jgi:hypothetical protein
MDRDLDMIPFTVNEIRRLCAINTAPRRSRSQPRLPHRFHHRAFLRLASFCDSARSGQSASSAGPGGGYPAAAAGAGERSPAPASPTVRERMGDGLNPLTMR